MKKFLFVLVLLMTVGTGFLSAQSSSLLIGPGVSYRIQDEFEGGHFRLYYALPKWLSFGPEFTYFIPTGYDGPDTTGARIIRERQVWTADFNIHIDIKIKNIATVYPLFGGNLTHVYEYDGEASEDGTLLGTPLDENYFGFNVGGGIHLFPKQIGPFFEYKWTLGDQAQRTITAGINFRIPLKKDDRSWVPDPEAPRQK